MVMSEMALAKEVSERIADEKAAKVILGPFTDICPKCRKGEKHWDMRRIKEGYPYDRVTYKCRCGMLFKKEELHEE